MAAAPGRFATERRLIALALPIAGGMIVEMGYGVIDTVLVGRVHPTALAAVGFGRLAMAPVVLFIGALLYGVQAVAARRMGAGDPEAAGTSARESLRLVLWVGLPFMALCFGLLDPVLGVALADPGVQHQSDVYLTIRLLGVPVIAAGMALRGFTYGVGKPGIDLVVSGASLVLNGVLSAWLIFGGFGMPALGVSGAALGSLVSEAAYLVVMALVVGHGAAFRKFAVRRRASDAGQRRTVLRLSAARAVQGLSLGAFPAFLAIMEKVGVIEAAAAQVVLMAASVFFFIGFGIGVAGGTLAAQSLGAGDPAGARRVALATGRVVLVVCGGLSLLLAALAVPIVAASTNDPLVREAALGPLWAYCAFLTLDALGAAFAKLLVAAGVAVYVMFTEILAGLCVFLPLSWWLGIRCGLGAWGVWAGFAGYILVFCTCTTVKICGRGWTQTEV